MTLRRTREKAPDLTTVTTCKLPLGASCDETHGCTLFLRHLRCRSTDYCSSQRIEGELGFRTLSYYYYV